MKNIEDMREELQRILEFIKSCVYENEKVVIPVSGGLDSDVVARLCEQSIGAERIHLFTLHQPHMEEKFLKNAENLAKDLGVSLAVIEPGEMNRELICILKKADEAIGFNPDSLLDPARANCAVRTAIICCYQDKGFLVAGNSNRSEIELGFFMPFGDNLGHFKPIAHLYKSEVKLLAELVHSRKEVIEQAPSAGFWEEEEDMEDLAYWLYNGGPVSGTRIFTDEDDLKVMELKKKLSQEKVDRCLEMISLGEKNDVIISETGMEENIVNAIRKTVMKSAVTKNRKLLVQLSR